jgi:hypothetical protein
MSQKYSKSQKDHIIMALSGIITWSDLARELQCSRQNTYAAVANFMKHLVMEGKITNIKKIIN